MNILPQLDTHWFASQIIWTIISIIIIFCLNVFLFRVVNREKNQAKQNINSIQEKISLMNAEYDDITQVIDDTYHDIEEKFNKQTDDIIYEHENITERYKKDIDEYISHKKNQLKLQS